MAEAMIQGILNRKLVPANKISCSDPRTSRLEELKNNYSISVSKDNAKVVADADIIVLSVKPQALKEVYKSLQKRLKPNQLVLSIIAGATTKGISAGLKHNRIVRAMPNTPARIGQGMTVWTSTSSVNKEDAGRVQALLSALGIELYVEHEEELDMATALSGTGPAYIFLFMEALVDAGVHMGFPRRIAQQLVLQTVKGSVEFAMLSPHHLAELRNQVTSPGGTSAEALYQMEKGGMRTVISKSVWWAFKKSRALSKLSEGQEE